MKVRAIRNSDPVYGAGDNNFVEGAEAVATLLNTRLKTFQGEVKRNIDFGIPDFKGLDKDDLDIEIGEIILTTAGVQEIIQFESSVSQRKYQATIVVFSDFGEVSVEVQV